MADSVPGKQAKGKSHAMNEVLENNLEKIASELDKGEWESADDVSLEQSQEELIVPTTSESLDDLLEFDAHVLASSSTVAADIENGNELSESEDNQYLEESCEDVVEEPTTLSNFAKENDLGPNKYVDENSEFDFEQQDSYVDSALINAQNGKLTQLEGELSALKKTLETVVGINKRLEDSISWFKKISVVAIIIAMLALLVSLWVGASSSGIPLKAGEQKRLVIDAKEPSVVSASKKIDVLTPESLALVFEIIQSEKILVVPEDDISEISTVDNSVKLKELDITVAKGWVVNLNSYEQLWEADKKIEELKKKGIVTEVIIVNVRGIRWYRIRVTGFKAKAEADSYATSIREILKVNHAWVSKM